MAGSQQALCLMGGGGRAPTRVGLTRRRVAAEKGALFHLPASAPVFYRPPLPSKAQRQGCERACQHGKRQDHADAEVIPPAYGHPAPGKNV